MSLLENKIAIVTGGSRGIGKSIVETFVAQGCKVAFTYRSQKEQADAIVAELGENVKAYQSDASDYAACEELVKQVTEDFGSVNILVNNAGITKDNLLMRMTEEDWNRVIQINLNSVFNLSKLLLRPMMKQRGGSIINMSSIVGMRGQGGQSNYAASKAGIIGFTKSLAQEMGSRNIRCNAIAPGYIETDMTDSLGDEAKENFLKNVPLKRLGQGNDIANTALYLASDLSSYVTGQVISVCGGLNC